MPNFGDFQLKVRRYENGLLPGEGRGRKCQGTIPSFSACSRSWNTYSFRFAKTRFPHNWGGFPAPEGAGNRGGQERQVSSVLLNQEGW